MALSGLRVFQTGIGALLLTIGALVQAKESIHKAVGEEITLVPQYTGSPSEINWKVNGDKLVDMEMSPLDIKFYRLQDRAKIDGTNGRLTITDLNKGDSARYKAEVLVNNIIQETNINLIVLDPPTKAAITNKTIDEKTIELNCKSVTPSVKYEWWDKTNILSIQQSYNASRSTEDVTLTCVVYNEASRINTTIIIPRLPDPGPPGGLIAFIVILVLVLLFLLIICILLKCFPDRPEAKRVIECLPCLACCISKKTNGEQNKIETQEEIDGLLIAGGGNRNDVEKGNAAKNENRNGMQEQENEHINEIPGESESCADVSLNVFSVGKVKSMKLYKDVMSVSAMLGGAPGTIGSLCLTVDNVEDPEDYTATVIRANGKPCVSTMKDADAIARITSVGGKVKFFVTNEGDVKTIDLKKGDKTRYCLNVEGQRVQINNITLEPESVTIKNLKPKDGGKYKVDIHCTDDSSTINTFTLKANELLENSPDKRTIELKVKREVTPENGLPDGEPIGNITFHPINIASVASIAWKKDNEPVDTKGNRIQVGQQGDLVINDVILADAGSYTVHSEGQTLEQEFILRL